jgi:hypothetical protein
MIIRYGIDVEHRLHAENWIKQQRQFEQVEGAEHGGSVVPVSANQVEDREPILVADDGLAVAVNRQKLGTTLNVYSDD